MPRTQVTPPGHRPTTTAGSDTAAAPGTVPAASSTATGAGTDSGLGTGAGTDSGLGTGTGTDSGLGTGTGTDSGAGTDSGLGTGASTGSGAVTGRDTGASAGLVADCDARTGASAATGLGAATSRDTGTGASAYTGTGPAAGPRPSADADTHPTRATDADARTRTRTRTRTRIDEAGADGADSTVIDVSAVDTDVSAAVGAAARLLLRTRVAQAAAVDTAFGRDVAGPVARFVLDGGKRMRPQFLWWAMRACAPGTAAAGEVAGAALQVAVGLELLQTCALLHDDVMDGSPVRRGRPAFHAAWDAAHGGTRRGPLGPTGGESAAVLAGDLALTWADDAVAAAPVPPDRAGALHAQWRLLRTELAAGQYLDVHGQTTACRVLRTAVRTALLKSAMYSVQRPLALGAVLAGAPAAAVRALSAAGRCAGLAFQLRDDLNDAFGDPTRTGRPAGADIRAGKATYLVAVAFRRAGHAGDRQALRVLDACVGDPGLSDDAQDEVRRVLEATGARQAVEADIAGLTVRALLHLRGPGAGLGADARRRIEDLVTTVAGVLSPEGAAGRVADVDPAIAAELAAAEEAADEESTW